MRTINDIRNEWVDMAGQEAEWLGFPRIAAELKVLLLLTPGPMSLGEMARRLEVSKASISTNIRILERWKLVRRVYHRGERRNFYEARGNPWEVATEVVSTILKMHLTEFEAFIARSTEDLKSIDAETPEDREQVQRLRDTFFGSMEYVEAAKHILDLVTQRGQITPAVLKKVTIK
ncbi:MAG TPA: helix-turn-helix domain-containing protein [Phycisphaerae bacterium]|nr:helix-turn-helix domain-containing protein [Phycisphaerae bacterium]